MLTSAQTRTLEFIEHYFSTHRQAPKLLEVAHGIGITSKGTVSRYINTLIEAGYLAKAPHKHRGLTPVTPHHPHDHSVIALIGKTSKFMQFQHCHSMHIKDDRLSDQGFYAGDTLWYVPSTSATANDVIMAYLDNTTPIIKRVQTLHGDFISLSCPHLDNKPRAYVKDRINIYGIIKGWLRQFDSP